MECNAIASSLSALRFLLYIPAGLPVDQKQSKGERGALKDYSSSVRARKSSKMMTVPHFVLTRGRWWPFQFAKECTNVFS